MAVGVTHVSVVLVRKWPEESISSKELLVQPTGMAIRRPEAHDPTHVFWTLVRMVKICRHT